MDRNVLLERGSFKLVSRDMIHRNESQTPVPAQVPPIAFATMPSPNQIAFRPLKFSPSVLTTTVNIPRSASPLSSVTRISRLKIISFSALGRRCPQDG
jgi:hypothetical protein